MKYQKSPKFKKTHNKIIQRKLQMTQESTENIIWIIIVYNNGISKNNKIVGNFTKSTK